jgi:hypothetical protein
MMRDPIWFKEFEREYNEREDRIAEIKERNNGFLDSKRNPIKKEWVSLTDEEIWHLSQFNCGTRGEFARAIETKLKEKNNG